MKGKVTLILLLFLVSIILVSEFIELMVYWFSDSSSLYESIGESSFLKFNRFLTLIALPLFVAIIVIGIDAIDEIDRYLLVGSAVFFVIMRLILLKFVIVFDYDDIVVDDYFSTKFYVHFILSAVSFAIIFAAIYYVLNYKLMLYRNWLIFFGMVTVDQAIVFTYQIVLVYLFNRNFYVESEFYKGIMLFPVFVIQLISALNTIIASNSRNSIIEIFDAK